MQSSDSQIPFKIMCESLGISVAKAAQLFGIPIGTAKKYADGSRTVTKKVYDQMAQQFAIIDAAAKELERLGQDEEEEENIDLPYPQWTHRAIRRRIIEIKAVKRHMKKFRRT